MKLKDILQHSISSETFNTNNAWGFGGGSGVSYKFNNGIEIRVGTASYRHAPPTPFVTVYRDGGRIMDEIRLTDSMVDAVYKMISI